MWRSSGVRVITQQKLSTKWLSPPAYPLDLDDLPGAQGRHLRISIKRETLTGVSGVALPRIR